MKSVKLCGRLFRCFASGFGQFATTQGGRAPHRGQVSPGADGGTALVGNHAWHRLPCLPLEHWWLTLREGHCARSVDLPNASFPLQGTRHSLSPSPVWCSSLPSHCRQVRQRDLTTKDSQVGLGNVGTPPELLQKRRLITATALIQQIFFFFCLFYGKDLKLNFVSWSMKDVSENTEEPPPHVALIKEKRETWNKTLDLTTLIFGRS